jgi:hypothetical protein
MLRAASENDLTRAPSEHYTFLACLRYICNRYVHTVAIILKTQAGSKDCGVAARPAQAAVSAQRRDFAALCP